MNVVQGPRAAIHEAPTAPAHRRNKSASVLKSIVLPSKGTRTPMQSPTRSGITSSKENTYPVSRPTKPVPLLPADHPHAPKQQTSTMKQSPADVTNHDDEAAPRRGLHKRNKSAISLRTLAKMKSSNKDKSRPGSPTEDESVMKPGRKNKSSTNLSTMFSKVKSLKSRDHVEGPPKDKENTTPTKPTSDLPLRTPIWEQMASQNYFEPSQQQATTTTIPLNDVRDKEQEIRRYEPRDYSPSKQRNFGGGDRPVLSNKRDARPKSDGLTPSNNAGTFMGAIGRKLSGDKEAKDGQRPAEPADFVSRQTPRSNVASPAKTSPQKGSRVMATVSMYNDKARDVAEPVVDIERQNAEFEAVLDAQNIPEPVRQKMRSLKPNVKADFIRLHRVESTATLTTPSHSSGFQLWSEADGSTTKIAANTPGVTLTAEDQAELANNILTETDQAPNSTKRSRPRSKTFTFSSKSNSSPTKKPKTTNQAQSPTKESNLIPHQTPSSTTTSKFFPSLGKSQPKPTAPEDYVSYLRRTQNPHLIDLPTLHKLRLLLRNESITWVDTFMKIGGMAEVVSLLHRIMAIEWRSEHDDQLLHETLLCLKALCTTDLALNKLQSIESTLFPALLGMLFDTEHKGPSEFVTRKVIVDLVFGVVGAARKGAQGLLEGRGETLLGFLRDPEGPEEKRPLGFIEEMRTKRPYKMWVKEIVDVTKEVFWIFLHHMNVVPLPSADSPVDGDDNSSTTNGTSTSRPTTSRGNSNTSTTTLPKTTPRPTPQPLTLTPRQYTTQFFPQPRPPVPAAPYVGGVEWDATNYLASHLDLLNALLACLPTPSARNTLRQDLKLSGLEKVMGGMLRTCKEKFYCAVHDGLRTWVAAGVADGWDVKEVRFGPKQDEMVASAKVKKAVTAAKPAPKIEVPTLDLGIKLDVGLKDDGARLGDWVL